MPQLQLLITKDDLQNHEASITWPTWLLAFIAGFLCGATADLSALWLFAHWMHR
jgi:hypothetical protein